MEDNYFRNIWELYGVRDNPFSTSPLLVKGGSLPIASFVGREELIKRLGKIISSKGGSRSFVYGDVGVGKTSFVNFVRYKALEQGFFTPFKEIAIQETWSPEDFVLNTLSAIYATLKISEDNPLKPELFEKLESLMAVCTTEVSAGISIAGSGANYGRSKKHALKLTNIGLQSFFEEIIKDIINHTKKDIIIHYNNLELLPEARIRHVFDNLRDFFQIPNVHFIFIGNLTTHGILQSLPRVSSIFSDTPLHVETLTLEQIKQIIEKRFQELKIEGLHYFIPYTDECLKKLYQLMEGNIRYILNSLSTAVLEATQEKPVQIDEYELAVTLKQVLDKRYLTNVTHREKEVLLEIVKHKEVTNKALSSKLNIQRSNISQYLKDLETAGCIFLRRKNGKDKFWAAEHRIKWALLEVPKKSQMSLHKFI